MVTNINHSVQTSAVYGQQQRSQKNEAAEASNKTEAISKVDRIKKEVEAGTYKVDFDKTARAIADILI